jgi:hypothetical protein
MESPNCSFKCYSVRTLPFLQSKSKRINLIAVGERDIPDNAEWRPRPSRAHPYPGSTCNIVLRPPILAREHPRRHQRMRTASSMLYSVYAHATLSHTVLSRFLWGHTVARRAGIPTLRPGARSAVCLHLPTHPSSLPAFPAFPLPGVRMRGASPNNVHMPVKQHPPLSTSLPPRLPRRPRTPPLPSVLLAILSSLHGQTRDTRIYRLHRL